LMPPASLPIRHIPPSSLLRSHILRISLHTTSHRVFFTSSILLNRLHSNTSRTPLKRQFYPFKNLKRGHMGGQHHHHHDDHDIALLTSKDTSNPGVRITRIGLYP